MTLIFGLLGLFCLGAAAYGMFRPEKVAFFVSEPTRLKVVGTYLIGALFCALALLLMTPGMGNEPATRQNSRSRYAMPLIPQALQKQAPAPDESEKR